MAEYLELRGLFNDAALLNRVDVAIVVAANAKLGAANPSVNEQKWAAYAARETRAESRKALALLLAQNKARTVLQIQGADDEGANSVQEAVDAVVDSLIVAYNS